jgi:hypothetical protein
VKTEEVPGDEAAEEWFEAVPRLLIPGTTAPDMASSSMARNAVRLRDSIFKIFLFLLFGLILSHHAICGARKRRCF